MVVDREPAASGAGRGHRLDWALAAVLAVLPLLPTGPSYLGAPPFPWMEAGALAIVGLWIASLLTEVSRSRPRSRLLPPVSTLVLLAVAVTGAMLVGLAAENPMFSAAFRARIWEVPRHFAGPADQIVDPLYSVRVWWTFIEGLIAAALVATICLRARQPARRAMRALHGALAGAVLVSLFAVVQYVTRFELHAYWVAANPDLIRSHSTLEDPNALGSYLVLMLGLAVGLCWRADGARARGVLAAATLVLGVGLATTVSRAAWGAPIVAVLLVTAWGLPPATDGGLALWQGRARRILGVSLAAVVLWLAAHAVLPARVGYQPAGPVDAMLATLDPRVPLTDVVKDRQVYWVAAARMAASHPFVGVGLGRFPRLGARYNDAVIVPDNAHHFFLQMLAEAGPAGVGGVALVLGGLVWTARRAAADARRRALAAGFSIAVVGLTMTLMTGHALLLPSIQILFGSLAAAWCVALDVPAARVPRRRWPVIASLVVLTAFVSAAALTPWDGAADDWGYQWGLYDREVDAGGVPFRWTSGSAWLHLVPPSDATAVTLPVAARLPHAPGEVTRITVSMGDQSQVVERRQGDWDDVTLALPAEARRGSGRGIDLHLRVEPVRVPARMGLSDDPRALGVALRAPVFQTGGDLSVRDR